MTLTYVSLFSGIEAFSVAASRVDGVNWTPVFFSEIDPFPCAVLAHRFPTVPNLGDICKIRVNTETNTVQNDDTTIPLPRNGIDILAGGSPCQDVSVAGRRAGMSEGSGTRSSLAFEYARLVDELRPRVILWENVPGVLSSNGGRDFLAFQRSLVERGYSLAWRVLDAQYARVDSAPRAVPQRRKRVWLVGCFGGDGRVPAQILFERAGVLGDTPPRREAGKGFAAPAGYGPARHDRMVDDAAGTIASTAAADCDGGLGIGVGENRPARPDSDAAQPRFAGNTEADAAGGSAHRTGDAGGGRRDDRGGDTAAASGRITGAGDVAAPLCAADGKGKNGMDIIGKCAVVPATFCESGFSEWHEGVTPLRVGGERPSTPINVAVVPASASFDGTDCAPTLHRPNGAPGYSDQELFAQQGAYLARCLDMTHADEVVREVEGGAAPTIQSRMGTGGNQVPLVVFGKTSHARNAAGDGERYEESEVAQTRNTFDGGESRAQEVVVVPPVCKTLSAEGFDGMPDIQKGNGQPVVAIDMDKCKPSNAERERSGGSGLGVSDSGAAYTVLAREASKQNAVAVGFNVCTSSRFPDGGAKEETASTLAVDHREGTAIVIGFAQNQREEVRNLENAATTISAEPGAHQQTYAAIGFKGGQSAAGGLGIEAENAPTLSHQPSALEPTVATSAIVRRLTPGECESLQFFPQGWTRIPYRGKPASECPDSPRYKALGNSWATNCAEWILRRIVAAFRLVLTATTPAC